MWRFLALAILASAEPTTVALLPYAEGELPRHAYLRRETAIVRIRITNPSETPLKGGGDNTWTPGDNWSVHSLVVTYDGSDTAYVPYIDEIATSDTAQVTVLFDQARTVVAKGRKAGRKPYDNGATGSLTSAGFTASAIMPDEPQYNM